MKEPKRVKDSRNYLGRFIKGNDTEMAKVDAGEIAENVKDPLLSDIAWSASKRRSALDRKSK